MTPPILSNENITAKAKESLETQIRGLQALKASLSTDFARAVTLLHAIKGRVILTGVGKSGHIGAKIAATMASTGTPAQFVHSGEASHGDLGMISKQDAVVALSKSGESSELRDILHYCKRFDIPLIGITVRPLSTLGRMANLCLTLPDVPEACPLQLAPTTSTSMTLALGDALAISLLEARGFQTKDFASFHPGGKLGAQLMKVEEIYTKNLDPLPLVEGSAPLSSALIAMSEGRRGCAAITDTHGKMIGIITDGDLRRILSNGENLDVCCIDVMSKEPKVIHADMLAVEALELMRTYKIASLFVVGYDQKLQGLVHIQDLVQNGVV